jgi:tRNA(Ile)-lysidine synthase
MNVTDGGLLHQTVQNFIHKHDLNLNNPIAVGVSGGPDSMALADVLAKTFEGMIYILCVNHGLRDDVDDEIKKISSWVQTTSKKNIELHVLYWQGDKPDNAVMEAARFARYDLLSNFCHEHSISSLFNAAD